MVGERVQYLLLVTLKEQPLTVSGASTVQPLDKYDPIRGEIHVMTGLNKDKDKNKRSGETRVSNSFNVHIHTITNCKQVSNSFWVYNLSSACWSVVYRNENNEPGYWTKHQSVEPRPR